jgi:Flp pilus assembly protein TadD
VWCEPGGTRKNRTDLAVRLAPEATAPLFELEAGRFEAAVADWKSRSASSTDLAKDLENFHNRVGLQLLRDGKTDAAITIFRAIVVVYPDSSNAQDSYGEALMKAGDKAGAIAAYEKSIALLERDPRVAPAERPTLRVHAESKIAQLRGAR